MKPNVAFDIDGIVANFSQPYLVWVKQEYGFTFTERDEFNWICDQGIPDKAFMRLIREFICDHSYLIKPLWDGADFVRYVWRMTAKPITFVTARDYATIGATHGWIRTHFPDIDSVIITVKSGKDKWRFLDEFDCFVEDRRSTAIDLASIGKIVFMPARKYNTLTKDGVKEILEAKNVDVAYVETADIKPRSIVYIKHCIDVLTGEFDNLIFKP